MAALPGLMDRRVLLTFCGTADRRKEITTIGDLMAVYNVALTLRGLVRQVDIAWTGQLFDLSSNTVDIDTLDPASYDAAIYVCGPVTKGVRKILSRFRSIKKIAVGVSVTTSVNPHEFIDAVYVRDSDTSSNFDLALANIGYPHFTAGEKARDDRIAMCLVGDQSEYGADDGYQKAAALAEQVAAVHRAVQVQTLLDEHRPIPASVEIDLQCATTMITTRMHGSLLAIFHGVPVIALDQINHGAKVTRMVSQLDWPVYNAWTTDAEAIARQLEQFRNNHPEKLLDHARGRLVKLSRQSLERAVECIMVELKSA